MKTQIGYGNQLKTDIQRDKKFQQARFIEYKDILNIKLTEQQTKSIKEIKQQMERGIEMCVNKRLKKEARNIKERQTQKKHST